jgi:hypothetical protein
VEASPGTMSSSLEASLVFGCSCGDAQFDGIRGEARFNDSGGGSVPPHYARDPHVGRRPVAA